MKIYLDIDGVLLNKDLTIPEFGEAIISFLTTNHDCYWLSTHCRGGNCTAVKYLAQYYPLSTVEQLKNIKQTNWSDLKTEAIDFNADFIWLEDYPFESEKRKLKENNKIDALITVDLKRKGELKMVQKKIEKISALYS